jgi:4-hydroxy-2-oxoglutarate aldolase
MFTGLNIKPETVGCLAEHPNIVGVKDSAGDIGQLNDIIRLSPPGFAVFTGAARVLHAALCVGAAGGMLALANVAPELCTQMAILVGRGEHEAARRLQGRLTLLERAILVPYGTAGWKAAMDLAGYRGGEPRLPLLPPDEEAQGRIRAALAEAGCIQRSG